ncbi:AAA family ATPase [Marinilongibacter aquaticus]|uniref:ParA family protein n=1 Tax=Marinilongibacter aquaticus TaxID=2975157 RepID=UPI0021BD1DAC|nr:AAA family ATPase [Marinilongibacter aquaticus]UBM60662.1 AAA family ATPase [Marinilongibacter aquaticus]
MIPKVIAISNQKGGVGKTTSSVNLSVGLAMRGYKVLLIDTDYQASCSVALGIDLEYDNRSIYAVLVNLAPIQDCIIPTGRKNLDIIPSTQHLVGAEIELVTATEREFILSEKLEVIKPLYDFIFIDCPPSLGIVPINSLVASDSIIIPLQCEYFGLEGLEMLLDTVKIIQKRLKPALYIEGILMTMYDEESELAVQMLATMRANFKETLFDTFIPRDIGFVDSTASQIPVIASKNPSSMGLKAYQRLILELLERYDLRKQK